jgi:hypothetical protein
MMDIADGVLVAAQPSGAPQPSKKPFDGLLTNDPFCFVRFTILPLSWWRRPLRMRTLSLESRGAIHAGGTDETRLEHPSPFRGEDQQPAPLGSVYQQLLRWTTK